MHFTPTPLAGLTLITPTPAADDRGCFGRTWCSQEFAAQGIHSAPVQCSFSFSRKRGTIRGLHYQATPFAEAKLIRVTRGAVYDVAVDVRLGSPTFGRWFSVELSSDDHRAVFVPEGFAHGFQTLTDDVEVFYQISAPHSAPAVRGLRWDDPAVGIDWPLPATAMSDRDRAAPLLSELDLRADFNRT